MAPSRLSFRVVRLPARPEPSSLKPQQPQPRSQVCSPNSAGSGRACGSASPARSPMQSAKASGFGRIRGSRSLDQAADQLPGGRVEAQSLQLPHAQRSGGEAGRSILPALVIAAGQAPSRNVHATLNEKTTETRILADEPSRSSFGTASPASIYRLICMEANMISTERRPVHVTLAVSYSDRSLPSSRAAHQRSGSPPVRTAAIGGPPAGTRGTSHESSRIRCSHHEGLELFERPVS